MPKIVDRLFEANRVVVHLSLDCTFLLIYSATDLVWFGVDAV